MATTLSFQMRPQENGDWSAGVEELPEVSAQGSTYNQAYSKALLVSGEKLERGGVIPAFKTRIFRSELSNDFESERETAYLAKSETMKTRLLEAIARDGEGAVSLEEARARLGV